MMHDPWWCIAYDDDDYDDDEGGENDVIWVVAFEHIYNHT